jgi:hypothetical protein
MPNAAGSVNIVLGMNAVTFTQGIKNAQAELDKFAGKSKAAGHSTVSAMQSASASIRLLENPLGNNTRAIERLASQSKLLRGIFSAAFPIVGAVAIGMVVGKLAMDVSKFIDTANKMPKAISQGFASMALASKTSTDAMQLSNDALQNSINKLEHKPQNNAKIAMDEATLAADKLATSIERSNASLNELLSKNHLSGLALLMGKQGTADREGTIKAFGAQSDSNAYDLANATNPQQTAAANKALQDTQNAELANMRSDLAQRQSLPKCSPDNSANIAIDKGTITAILNQQKENATQIEAAKLEAQNKSLEASKTALEQAKAAAQKRVEAMQDALDAMKLQNNMSLKAVYDYWDGMKAGEQAGGTAYNDIVKKQSEIAVEAATRAHEQIAKAIAQQKSSSEQGDGSDVVSRAMADFQRNAVKTIGDQAQQGIDTNALGADSARNDAREKEAQVTEEAGKSMSHYAAALQLAAIHAQELKTVMASLQSDLSIKQAEYAASPTKENAKAVSDAQVAVANAGAAGQIQSARDQQNINPPSTSGLVGATDALNDFIAASKDSATQVREFTTTTLNGFNDAIVKIISTPHQTGFQTRRELGNYGAGLFRSVAGTGLQKAEGSALGAFGLGGSKVDGKTPQSALYVNVVNAMKGIGGGGPDGTGSSSTGFTGMANRMFGTNFGSGINSGINALSGLFTSSSAMGVGAAGLSSAEGIASAGGDVSPIASTLTSMIPFLATGGSINGPAIVGEQGPELFLPSGKGNIIPNHKLSSYGVGNQGHTINIDATGSNDPAQVEAAVNRGIAKAAPHIMAGSVHAMTQQNRRRAPAR